MSILIGLGKHITEITKDGKSDYEPAYFSFWPVRNIEEDFDTVGVEDAEVERDKRDNDKTDDKGKKFIGIVFSFCDFCYSR
jgi:hypothetical protein